MYTSPTVKISTPITIAMANITAMRIPKNVKFQDIDSLFILFAIFHDGTKINLRLIVIRHLITNSFSHRKICAQM